VTELSGRGVGLDVVQKVVHSLNGQVEVHSTPGEGCLFTIRLPLTMAMIEGLLVRVGNERYIIPTNAVIRSVRPKPDEILTVANKEELLGLNDKWIPLYRMRTLFGIESDESGSETPVVVILQDHGQQAGMVIDEIIGNHEVVIKSLGKSFQNIDGISGGAFLADGQVVLIFDVGSLLKMKKKYTTQNIII
jgi:two-component system chemotaxis sensor kinase CheA